MLMLDSKDANDNLYFFNKNLLDYGKHEDFEAIKTEYALQEKTTETGKFWYTQAEKFLSMLKENRNLLFVIFCNIPDSGDDIVSQREMIFGPKVNDYRFLSFTSLKNHAANYPANSIHGKKTLVR